MSYEKIIQLNDSSLFEIYLSARMVRAYDYCPVPVNQQLSLLEEGRTTENKQKHISCPSIWSSDYKGLLAPNQASLLG